MLRIRTLTEKKEKLQWEYLIVETAERERLTERYVDQEYEWHGGFD